MAAESDQETKPHAEYAAEWEKNAKLDPLYAILSSPDAVGGKWNVDDFFASGETEIALVFRQLETVGCVPRLDGKFLDFGCGVGRISRALGLRFHAGTGIDISPRMIEMAKAYNATDPVRIDYVLNKGSDLRAVETGSIDFLYSHIVLQHIPNELQERFISEFCRVLAPGGIAAFQIPIDRIGRKEKQSETWAASIKRMVPQGLKQRIKDALGIKDEEERVTMEMNYLSDMLIRKIIAKGGCTLKEISYSNSTEPNHNGKLDFFDRSTAENRINDKLCISDFISAFYFVCKE